MLGRWRARPCSSKTGSGHCPPANPQSWKKKPIESFKYFWTPEPSEFLYHTWEYWTWTAYQTRNHCNYNNLTASHVGKLYWRWSSLHRKPFYFWKKMKFEAVTSHFNTLRFWRSKHWLCRYHTEYFLGLNMFVTYWSVNGVTIFYISIVCSSIIHVHNWNA
jgi:hypothetical protein